MASTAYPVIIVDNLEITYAFLLQYYLFTKLDALLCFEFATFQNTQSYNPFAKNVQEDALICF